MGYEKAVLSVSAEDIRGYVDGETWRALVEGDLVADAVDLAARYMQKYLDQGDFFEEMCVEAGSRVACGAGPRGR